MCKIFEHKNLISSNLFGVKNCATLLGVEAAKSAAKSHRLSSISWPIPVITGTREAAIARTNFSSLKTAKSSALPPPRIIVITSGNSLCELKKSIARIIWSLAEIPCTCVCATVISSPPQRSLIILIKSA